MTSSYANIFGPDCIEEYAWCPESGMTNRSLALLPGRVDECEAVDLDVGCGTGSWVLTVRVGPLRLPTCGF